MKNTGTDFNDLNLLVESMYSEEGRDAPSEWDKGFTEPLRLKTGEVPFQLNGNWYIYVWDDGDPNKEAVYSYSQDLVIPYDEFQQNLEQSKKRYNDDQ